MGGGSDEAGGSGSGSSRLRGRSGREQRREERQQHGRGLWMPPAAAAGFSPPGSNSESGTEAGSANGGASNGGSSLRPDKEQLAYVVRRQLKAFTSDPRQRLLAFPRSFSAGDRYQVGGCSMHGVLYMLGAWGMQPTASRSLACPALRC